MRDIKEGENGQYSDAIQALQALKYDEPADDDAEYARIEGNKHFKLGKFRWARDAYTNGRQAFIRILCITPANSRFRLNFRHSETVQGSSSQLLSLW